MADTRTAIVGGGLLGCALARRLAETGHRVTVYEASPEVGGLAGAWSLGPITWDRFYHVILQSDAAAHDLLRDLDLESSYVGRTTRTAFYTGGRHHPFTTAIDFLRFRPLGLISKLRLAATILYASRLTNWRRLEAVTAADWLARWSGRRTTELIWEPLLRAKLGDAAGRVNAAFIWATIARMYAARRSGLKQESFGSVRGGYATILGRLTEFLTEKGVELRTGTPVESVRKVAGELVVTDARGEGRTFDRVVLTTPTPLAARLLPDLPPEERARLNGLEYQGVVCLSILLKSLLTDCYVTNITDDVPFTAVIAMTALVPPEEFGNHHLVYIPKYAAQHDAIWQESDDSVTARFVTALKTIYPQLRDEDIITTQVARVKHVFAVPTLHYSERVPPFATSIDGVSIVTAAQIVNGTLNVNETLLLADRAFREALAPTPGVLTGAAA